MRKLIFLLLVGLFLYSTSFAKIFRVGYAGTPLAGVDYTTDQISQAVGAASAHDTIQIYGSVWGIEIYKPLVIIGFGYNLDVHPGLQVINDDMPSYIEGIFFGPGSDGSVVEGITSNGSNAGFQCGDYYQSGTPVSNITFERCSGYFNLFNHAGALSNIKIIDCVVKGLRMYFGAEAPVTNLQVYNCIFGNGEVNLYNASTTASIINCVSTNGYGSYIRLREANTLVKNCIIWSHDYYGENINTTYNSNFFGEAQPGTLPAGSNNHWGQDWAALFNRLGGTDDAPGAFYNTAFDENYYILKAGSAAISTGLNNASQTTDCGIFGGEAAYIYKPSGVPQVPSIYKLTAASSSVTATPYNITVSVRGEVKLKKLEYYIDTDPGYGQGIAVALDSLTDISNYAVPVNVIGFSTGNHTFWIRVLDKNGNWSLMNSWAFNVTDVITQPVVYTFNGNGNWSDSANWVNKMIPPEILDNGSKIIINPQNNGVCNIDITQFIIKGSNIVIQPGKKINLTQSLKIGMGVQTVSSKVILPEQATMNIKDVTVYSFLHKVTPDQNGDFKIAVQAGKSEDVLLATNKSGNTMFLKYLTDTTTDFSVSSESTALALLLLYPLQVPVLPEQKKELTTLYRSQPEFGQLITEVASICNAEKDLFDSTNDNLINLLNTLISKNPNSGRNKPMTVNSVQEDKGPVSIESSDNGTVVFSNSAIVSYTAQIYRIKDNTPVGAPFTIAGEGLRGNSILKLIVTILKDFDTDETADQRSINLAGKGQTPGEYGIKITSGDPALGNEPLNMIATQENVIEMLSNVLGNLIPGLNDAADIIQAQCFKDIVKTVVNAASYLNILNAVQKNDIIWEYIKPMVLNIGEDLAQTTGKCTKDEYQNQLISKLFKYANIIDKALPLIQYGSSWATNRKTITGCQFLDEDLTTSDCFLVKFATVQENTRVCKTLSLKASTVQNEQYYPYVNGIVGYRNIKWYALNGGIFPSANSSIVTAKTDNLGDALIDWQAPSIEMDAKVKVAAQLNGLDFTKDEFDTKTSKYDIAPFMTGGGQDGEINKVLPKDITLLLTDQTGGAIPEAIPYDNYTVKYDVFGGGAITLKDVSGGIVTYEWKLGPDVGQQSVNFTIISKPCDNLSLPEQLLSLTYTATAHLPTGISLTTFTASNVTLTSASTGGNITSDGGSPITFRGICWSTSHNPTISDNKTNDGTGSGSFTSNMSSLASGITYYVRAYATNAIGTAYGDEISFTTKLPFPCNVYFLEMNGISDYGLWTQAFNSNDITLATWIKITDPTSIGKRMAIFSRYDYNTYSENTNFGLYLNEEGKFVFRGLMLGDNGQQEDSLVFGTKPVANTWYHIAVTFNGTSHQCNVYINGLPDGTKTFVGPLSYVIVGSAFSKTLSYGARYYPQNGGILNTYFKGYCDEAVYASKAMSAASIKTLASGITPGDAFISDNSIVIYNKFDNYPTIPNNGVSGGSLATSGQLHTCSTGTGNKTSSPHNVSLPNK